MKGETLLSTPHDLIGGSLSVTPRRPTLPFLVERACCLGGTCETCAGSPVRPRRILHSDHATQAEADQMATRWASYAPVVIDTTGMSA